MTKQLNSKTQKKLKVFEAYIEKQIENNEIDYCNQLQRKLEYSLIGHVILTYLLYVGYENKYKYILNEIEYKNPQLLEELKEQLETFKKQLDEGEELDIDIELEKIGND